MHQDTNKSYTQYITFESDWFSLTSGFASYSASLMNHLLISCSHFWSESLVNKYFKYCHNFLLLKNDLADATGWWFQFYINQIVVKRFLYKPYLKLTINNIKIKTHSFKIMTIHKHSLTNVNEQAFIHLSACNAEGTNTNYTECYKGPALFHLAALMLKAKNVYYCRM